MIIYISGIDGCGKTTQCKILVDTLRKRGFDADYRWLRWEPSFQKVFTFFCSLITRGRTKRGADIIELENVAHGKWYDFKTKLLSIPVVRQLWWLHACVDYFITTRKHFRNLNGRVLIIDRYVIDFIIDQACNMGLSPENCLKLNNNIFLRRFKHPDLQIIMDLPASEGYARKHDGTSLSYLKQREIYYKSLPASDNTVHLDALKDIHSIAREIAACVAKKLAGVQR